MIETVMKAATGAAGKMSVMTDAATGKEPVMMTEAGVGVTGGRAC